MGSCRRRCRSTSSARDRAGAASMPVKRNQSRWSSPSGPPSPRRALLLLVAAISVLAAAAAPSGPALAGDRAAALARAAAGDSLRALGELPRAETAYRDALA